LTPAEAVRGVPDVDGQLGDFSLSLLLLIFPEVGVDGSRRLVPFVLQKSSSRLTLLLLTLFGSDPLIRRTYQIWHVNGRLTYTIWHL
jgi:hypothetical protein